MNFLKLAFIYIQKAWHFVLRDVFIYKKPDTSQKSRQFALRFFYTKSLTLCFTQFFMKVLKLTEGGRFYTQKIMHFTLHLYIQITMYFPFDLYIHNYSYRMFWYLTINLCTIRAIITINKIELFIENWSNSYDK